MINHAFNNFCESWFKIFLSLINILYNAQTIAKFEYVIKTIHNIIDIRREISGNVNFKHVMRIDVSRMIELHKSLRTVQLLTVLYRNRSLNIWEKSWNFSAESLKNWKSNNHEYHYEQLRAIKKLSKYKHISKSLWLKNNVFCLFFHQASINRWHKLNLQEYFNYRVQIMRKRCNRHYSHTTLNADILM